MDGVTWKAKPLPALKPSLVEWKPSWRIPATKGRGALKPSLVEWKQDLWGMYRGRDYGLETFLGGMETCGHFLPTLSVSPLKPSLVEWKHPQTAGTFGDPIRLETFLGGMPIRLIISCDKLVYNVPFLGCVRFCVRYCTEGRGLAAPFFYGLQTLHGRCPSWTASSRVL